MVVLIGTQKQWTAICLINMGLPITFEIWYAQSQTIPVYAVKKSEHFVSSLLKTLHIACNTNQIFIFIAAEIDRGSFGWVYAIVSKTTCLLSWWKVEDYGSWKCIWFFYIVITANAINVILVGK